MRVMDIGKLREANESLKNPIVSEYLQRIRQGEDAGVMVDKMLSAMSRPELLDLIGALIAG